MKWNFVDTYDERYFMDYDMAQLGMDSFYLKFNTNSSDLNLYLYTLNKECIQCPYLSRMAKPGCKNDSSNSMLEGVFRTHEKFRIATEYKEYFPQNQKENVICDIDYNFGQFGVYNIDVNNTDCFVTTLKEPVNIYTPIFTVFLIYVALSLLIYGGFLIWDKWNQQSEDNERKAPKKERVLSLDTFRGLTIVLMIFANFGAGGYEFIEHAIWNGLHLADLVFPCFMWIMGVCIPISLTSSFKKNISNKTMILNVLKRSVKLFLIGIFLGSGSSLKYLRIFGVLQRFAVAYLVVTVICIYCMRRSDKEKDTGVLIVSRFDDIVKIYSGWIVVTLILLLHTVIIFSVAEPGCPRGYMGPGGLHKNQSYGKCVGGITGYIDGLILGNHRYQNPTIYEVFEAKPFDPEGVFGCLTTIFQVFIGVQAGTTLIVYKSHFERLIRWLIWAILTGVIGAGLCGFSKEDGIIPVNKNLWSLSFVMITSCVAFFLLSFCYILIDVKKWWSGKPFLFAGMNAMLMYIGHEMTDGHFPVRWITENEAGIEKTTHFVALLSDSWGAAMWVLVSYYLYKINYFYVV